MAYNKTVKSGDNVYGDYHQKSYQTYSPKKLQDYYGIGKSHRYSEEPATEPITTKVQKELGHIDHFEKTTSSKRPIKTTASTHRG